MLAVDFFHVDCAITLKRIYVLFALERWAAAQHSVAAWATTRSCS